MLCLSSTVTYIGVENWILCKTSLKRLESFQGELAKRILKLPKWYSNTAACVALGWHSKLVTKKDNVAYRVYSSLVDDVESLCIVKECRELEGRYGSDYTSNFLASDLCGIDFSIKEVEKFIFKKDRILQLKKAAKYSHLCTIADTVGWRKLGDHTLDEGRSCVTGIRNLV